MNRALIILLLTFSSALSQARTEAGVNLPYGVAESSYGSYCSFCGPTRAPRKSINTYMEKDQAKQQARRVAETDDAQGKTIVPANPNLNTEDPNL